MLRVYDWRVRYRDVDHHQYMSGYMNSTGSDSPTGKPMNREQKLWFCIIYALAYQPSMAWTLYWNFPNVADIDFDTIEEFNNDTYSIQRFARDTKYNKGKWIKTFKDVHLKILNKYGTLSNWADQIEGYTHLFNEMTDLHKIGRMSGWLACQQFYETGCIPHAIPDNFLATDKSNWSVRTCVAFVFDRPELMDLKGNTKYTSGDLKWIADRETELVSMFNDSVTDESYRYFASPYTMESHLCQWKKMIHTSKDFPGATLQEAYHRSLILNEDWTDVQHSTAWDEVIPYHPSYLQYTLPGHNMIMKLGTLTGQLINLHNTEGMDDQPNMYLEVGIEPEILLDQSNSDEIGKAFKSYYKQIGVMK